MVYLNSKETGPVCLGNCFSWRIWSRKQAVHFLPISVVDVDISRYLRADYRYQFLLLMTALEKIHAANKLWTKIQNLPYKYPVEAQTTMFLNLSDHNINNYFLGSWPVLPKRVSILIKNFIQYKKFYGSNVEKAFYRDYTVSKMISRW